MVVVVVFLSEMSRGLDPETAFLRHDSFISKIQYMWIIATLNKTHFYPIDKVHELVVMIQEFLT